MEETARYLGTTASAVSYTIYKGSAELMHKNAGRQVKFPEDKAKQVIAYVEDYIAKDKVAGLDKPNRRRMMEPLTYNMIRDNVLKDPEKGEVPIELRVTDNTLKRILNKHGLYLRAAFPAHKIAEARARGKRQWQDKLEKDKKAAEALARAGDQAASPEQGQEEDSDDAEAGPSVVRMPIDITSDEEDHPMDEVYSGTESISEDDHDDEDDDQDVEVDRRPGHLHSRAAGSMRGI